MEGIEGIELDDLFDEFEQLQEEIDQKKENEKEGKEGEGTLTEQNVVEMIYYLKAKGMIDRNVYTTTDGESIVTKEKLKTELYEAIERSEGRIHVQELEDIMNMERSTVEKIVEEEVQKQFLQAKTKKETQITARKIVYYKVGEIITEEYINNMGVDINEWIQNYGIIDMATLTERYALPLPYIEKTVTQYLMKQGWIEGKLLGDAIYTKVYLKREKKKVEFYLKALSEPHVLFHDQPQQQTITLNEHLFVQLMQELLQEKVVRGEYIRKHNVFIPEHYENTVMDEVEHTLQQNSVVSYQLIRKRRAYLRSAKPPLKKKYKRQQLQHMSEAEAYLRGRYDDQLIYLSNAACSPLLCTRVDEAVTNALQQNVPLDLFHIIPAQLDTDDIKVILKQCSIIQDYFSASKGDDDDDDEEEEEEDEMDEGYSHSLNHELPFQLFGYGFLMPKEVIHELINVFDDKVKEKVMAFQKHEWHHQQQEEEALSNFNTPLDLMSSKQRRKALQKRQKQRAHVKQFAKAERKKRIQRYMLQDDEIDHVLQHKWQYGYAFTGVDDMAFNLRHVIETIYVPQLFYHHAFGQPKYPDVAQKMARLKKKQPHVDRHTLLKRLTTHRDCLYQRLEFYSKSICTSSFDNMLKQHPAFEKHYRRYLLETIGKPFLTFELALQFVHTTGIPEELPFFLMDDDEASPSQEDIEQLDAMLPEQLEMVLASITNPQQCHYLCQLSVFLGESLPSEKFLKEHQIELSSPNQSPFRDCIQLLSSQALYPMDKKSRRLFRQQHTTSLVKKLERHQEALARACDRLTSQKTQANFDDLCQKTMLIAFDYFCCQQDWYVPEASLMPQRPPPEALTTLMQDLVLPFAKDNPNIQQLLLTKALSLFANKH